MRTTARPSLMLGLAVLSGGAWLFAAPVPAAAVQCWDNSVHAAGFDCKSYCYQRYGFAKCCAMCARMIGSAACRARYGCGVTGGSGRYSRDRSALYAAQARANRLRIEYLRKRRAEEVAYRKLRTKLRPQLKAATRVVERRLRGIEQAFDLRKRSLLSRMKAQDWVYDGRGYSPPEPSRVAVRIIPRRHSSGPLTQCWPCDAGGRPSIDEAPLPRVGRVSKDLSFIKLADSYGDVALEFAKILTVFTGPFGKPLRGGISALQRVLKGVDLARAHASKLGDAELRRAQRIKAATETWVRAKQGIKADFAAKHLTPAGYHAKLDAARVAYLRAIGSLHKTARRGLHASYLATLLSKKQLAAGVRGAAAVHFKGELEDRTLGRARGELESAATMTIKSWARVAIGNVGPVGSPKYRAARRLLLEVGSKAAGAKVAELTEAGARAAYCRVTKACQAPRAGARVTPGPPLFPRTCSRKCGR